MGALRNRAGTENSPADSGVPAGWLLGLFRRPVEGKGMDRRAFLVSALAVAGRTKFASAQSPAKALKIGYLSAQQQASFAPYLTAFRQGFSELGYVEGQNL